LQDQDQDQDRCVWSQTGLVLRRTVSDHITHTELSQQSLALLFKNTQWRRREFAGQNQKKITKQLSNNAKNITAEYMCDVFVRDRTAAYKTYRERAHMNTACSNSSREAKNVIQY